MNRNIHSYKYVFYRVMVEMANKRSYKESFRRDSEMNRKRRGTREYSSSDSRSYSGSRDRKQRRSSLQQSESDDSGRSSSVEKDRRGKVRSEVKIKSEIKAMA